jgi:hypothetical protein
MAGATRSASDFDRIEVVARSLSRRWSLGEKLKAAEKSRLFGMTISYVTQK